MKRLLLLKFLLLQVVAGALLTVVVAEALGD
jgi:hypothetical protein